jgi:hypothetical protein
MRFLQFSTRLGLAAVLFASVSATALAAPTEQGPGWVVVPQPQWDPAQQWYSRTVVVQPTTAVVQAVPATTLSSVPVTVLAPTGVVQTFAEPVFVNTFQEAILPTIVGVVPVETIQSGIQVLQVEPNLNALVAPQFFCPPDSAVTCQTLAAQLAARRPGFTTVTLNGPLGSGVYVAYRV